MTPEERAFRLLAEPVKISPIEQQRRRRLLADRAFANMQVSIGASGPPQEFWTLGPDETTESFVASLEEHKNAVEANLRQQGLL